MGSIFTHSLGVATYGACSRYNTGQSNNCKEPPEALEPVSSAVWSNSIVIPNQVVFVKLSQIDVFVDSINTIRGCKTQGPVAVKRAEASQFVLGVKRMSVPTIMMSSIVAGSTHAVYCKTLLWV